jgi:hypothetical protein
MNRHRNIIFSAGLLAAIVVATPVAAHASPLLSGYGGPGQGSQLILGSSLLNGPGGGGGAAAAGEASPAATGGGLGSAPAGSTSRSSASAVHAAHGSVLRPGSSGAAPAGTPGVAPGTPGVAPGTPGVARGTPGGALGTPSGALGTYPARQAAPPALGVSEQDVLFIVLALGILAFAGVLTRRLTYPRSGPARGAER